MNHQAATDRVGDARRTAEAAEQIAHEVRRTFTAVGAIAEDARFVYETVISPLVQWLKSLQDCEGGAPIRRG